MNKYKFPQKIATIMELVKVSDSIFSGGYVTKVSVEIEYVDGKGVRAETNSYSPVGYSSLRAGGERDDDKNYCLNEQDALDYLILDIKTRIQETVDHSEKLKKALKKIQ